MRVPKKILFVKEKTFDVLNTELYIVMRRYTLFPHLRIWEKLLNKEFAKFTIKSIVENMRTLDEGELKFRGSPIVFFVKKHGMLQYCMFFIST